MFMCPVEESVGIVSKANLGNALPELGDLEDLAVGVTNSISEELGLPTDANVQTSVNLNTGGVIKDANASTITAMTNLMSEPSTTQVLNNMGVSLSIGTENDANNPKRMLRSRRSLEDTTLTISLVQTVGSDGSVATNVLDNIDLAAFMSQHLGVDLSDVDVTTSDTTMEATIEIQIPEDAEAALGLKDASNADPEELLAQLSGGAVTDFTDLGSLVADATGIDGVSVTGDVVENEAEAGLTNRPPTTAPTAGATVTATPSTDGFTLPPSLEGGTTASPTMTLPPTPNLMSPASTLAVPTWTRTVMLGLLVAFNVLGR